MLEESVAAHPMLVAGVTVVVPRNVRIRARAVMTTRAQPEREAAVIEAEAKPSVASVETAVMAG